MSKQFKSLAGHFNMMDDNEEPGEGEIVAEDTGAGVDAGQVEVTDAGAAIEAEDTAIQELVEAHEGLTEVAEAMEESNDAGGLTQESARYCRMYVAKLVGKYPNYLPDSFMTFESFGSTSNRARSTSFNLEGVKEMIKDFWKLIWAKIQKLYATVRNWFQKVLGAAPRLKKKAEALSEAASKRNGVAEEKKITFGDAKHLAIGGKPAAPAQVLTGLGAINEIAGGVLGGSKKEVEDGVDAICDGLAHDADPAKKTAAISALSAAMTSYATVCKAGGSVTGPRAVAGATNKMTGELLGGKAIIVVAPSTAGVDKGTSRALNISLTSFSDKAKEVTSDEMATASLSDIAKIGDLISDLCDHVVGYQKLWQSHNAAADKLNKAVSSATGAAEKADDAEKAAATGAKELAQAGGAICRKVVAFESSLINYALTAGRAALIYGERSLAQYKSA